MSFFTSTRPRNVLALQGGGAHGAFTWGALDRLLENGLTFSAATGVSSGALIAAMAVQGYVHNGPNGARAAVTQLWQRVADAHIFSNLNSALDWMWGGLGNDLAWAGITNALRLFSPGQLNPFGQNPLGPLLADLLDLDAIRDAAAPRLYVGATDVESGEARVFTNAEISVDTLLASACIPMMFPTVTIDGRAYWDGGYSCNPPLAPVLTPAPSQLVLIRAQPRARRGVPSSTVDILHRLHEIAFQAPLDAELALLPSYTRLLDISADAALSQHPLTSKMNVERSFLDDLFIAGREAAARLTVA
ncbi:MAG TPA: patatin-like phospholipase family protein [Acidocella sp.]|jgi:NTE family protein|uniref:patatin-like phospholipase family protein n=1 Tax=Acidocella sp. TaxID=50710 RepID=UPI002C007D49|nr:patatin-like phospholipase family protein [Acidocella sp.]HVE21761.1 patatin-like phospholipase family protein [Acidocella sp.]